MIEFGLGKREVSIYPKRIGKQAKVVLLAKVPCSRVGGKRYKSFEQG